MALDVVTNDASALEDTDLDELASMDEAFSAGQLSKAKEDWVLITTARFGNTLHGFTFSTLERIGGTPCVLIGLMSVKRSSKRDQVLRGLMSEAYHRALMAFPDEDVVVGSRFVNADAREAFKDLDGVTPSPGDDAVGEERAWGRRLAKRFGDGQAQYDDRAFRVRGDGSLATVLDHEVSETSVIADDLHGFFAELDPHQGDSLIAFAWAMAEDLERYA